MARRIATVWATIVFTLLSMVDGTQISLLIEPQTVSVRTGDSIPIVATLTASAKPKIQRFTIEFSCRQTDVCEFENSTHEVAFDSGPASLNLTLWALFLGRTTVNARIVNGAPNTTLRYENRAALAILRTTEGQTLSTIFTYVLGVFIIANTFAMGTQLDIRVILKVVKRPIGPVIGFCCQYLLMPCLAFGFATVLLSEHPGLQFGYFAVGCSPGGGMSNFWTILLEGNLDLSVTMTFFSNIGALAMLPLWILTLGRQFYTGGISIPFVDVVRSLLILIIPACLGMLFIYFKPHLAEGFKKWLKIITLVVMLVALPFGIYANLFVFSLIRWYTMVPGLLLPWTGYTVSYVAALLLKQEHKECRTIAIETGIQNAMIAVLVCRFSLPEPDSDLALVMPISVLMFTSTPLWVALIVLKCYKRHQKKQENNAKEKSEQPKVVVENGPKFEAKINDVVPVSSV